MSKNYLSVVIRTVETISVVFRSEGKYEVTDKIMAANYLKNVTGRLIGQTAFGDKFATAERKLPSLRIKADYFVMFDGSE